MHFEFVPDRINNLTQPGYVVGSGKRSLTRGEIRHIVETLIVNRNPTHGPGTRWPFEAVIVPVACTLRLDGRSALRLTRAVLDALEPDERHTCMEAFGDALTVGIKFLMKSEAVSSVLVTGTNTRAYTNYKMDILEYMSIPEAVRFCRGLTAHVIYRVFTRKGEHGLVPPKPVKEAILDLLCAPKPPLPKQVPRRRANARDFAFHETRGYTGFLRKYCKRHKMSIHIDEVRCRVGQTQHRRMMVIARALGPVLMLDEAFRMRVTIKLISKFPGTRRMAEKILVAESRQP